MQASICRRRIESSIVMRHPFGQMIDLRLDQGADQAASGEKKNFAMMQMILDRYII